jgi:Zn-dependent peptidase ImmA (M78 family)
MRRLAAAGFKREIAREVVLPDWWDDSCASDPSLLPEIELRVARFVDAPLSLVRAADQPLSAPDYPGAQLRRVRDIHRDRLGPAIHLGLRVAEAAIRSWRGALPSLRVPPADPNLWREEMPRSSTVVRLPDVLADLWARGIPVIHIALMPSPSYQGMVCIVEGRPVVVLAHDFDEPARLAFVIAHEVAHVVHGDCEPGHPVVDEEDINPDDHDAEKRADMYSVRVLAGAAPIPRLEEADPKALARRADEIEQEHGVDAALVVRSWGKRTGEHAKATLAVAALYGMKGGKRAIREAFDRHIDLDGATETDRALLRCLHGEPQGHATPG